MSSISSIRLSGLATGMDTDAMVKSMLTADQEKIEKAGGKAELVLSNLLTLSHYRRGELTCCHK